MSNTNIMMVGGIGWGKTNTAMALAVRNLPFGRRVVVPGDPKDDWLRLALALGGEDQIARRAVAENAYQLSHLFAVTST